MAYEAPNGGDRITKKKRRLKELLKQKYPNEMKWNRQVMSYVNVPIDINIMYNLPRTMTEAATIINSYIDNHACAIFTETTCPFCINTLNFLDFLNIRYENVPIDEFGNKQLLQNHLVTLCGNNNKALQMPVMFVNTKHLSDTMQVDKQMETSKDQSDKTNVIANANQRQYLIGADEIAKHWSNGQWHSYFPHTLSPDLHHRKYQTGEWNNEDWKKITTLIQTMTHSYGYHPSETVMQTKRALPDPKTIFHWSKFVGMPILTKDIASPQRPIDSPVNPNPFKGWRPHLIARQKRLFDKQRRR
ncbi:hypothetical protein RFI_13406 [Reticulomyxa filosa]|uniref:Glutaredoxin domain-containing protein n=1 Tax=Reticulomyxa filosa TaxID=46433 RepID=X6NBU7_RETFI|nr:hypothetical protein RFI_13406 [Reticulomyxa filosa]|eukprot:ETO23770.1 hypothetical protein RFI_13406 [Reticulomyxa filosa]